MGHKKLVKFESQILPTAQRRGVSNNRSSDDPDIITRCAHVEGFFDALHAPLIALTDANGVYNDFIPDQQCQISPVSNDNWNTTGPVSLTQSTDVGVVNYEKDCIA